ncbi:tektin-4 [Latimeria chalumnae]|uniref:Tektin n=1 Tax=Latimeria chalumnae TaxID=7897 RepID=H3AHP5_LATCH|nr:PREDICTED: tektin-4 [Latimeria chalumnae]|eukprot:XP_005997853.1 PREDICTED: tektin-4 [Latimeria chalumnae]
MATEILINRQPAPQSIPVTELPVKSHQPAVNTGEFSSSGLATAGFRTAKYSPDEWHGNNYNKYYQAFADRDGAEKVRHESKRLSGETEALTQRTQMDSTKKLGERLQDIHFWKSELQKEIEDLIAETDLLLAQKRRLENALDASEIVYAIATDNLQCRERRIGTDLVKDIVEVELLKEVELVRNVQELLKRTLEQAINQIRANRDMKLTLEMDWSDKFEAYEIDVQCGKYNNQSTDVQYHLTSAKYEDNTSTPKTWAEFTHDNIFRAEREKKASAGLRALIDSILHDTTEDLRAQCAAVDLAFAKRCEEMNEAKCKLEEHLKNVLWEIGAQEKNIADLKQAIRDKEAPMKVAQTRLYQRSYRPNVELCRDHAQFRLVSEVTELAETIEALHRKLEEAQQSLKNLEDTRMTLEKEICIKANSLFIDRGKCMTHRTRYPTVIKLSGY